MNYDVEKYRVVFLTCSAGMAGFTVEVGPERLRRDQHCPPAIRPTVETEYLRLRQVHSLPVPSDTYLWAVIVPRATFLGITRPIGLELAKLEDWFTNNGCLK